MMIQIPQQIILQFDVLLKKENVSLQKYNSYKKWLRYYLDFCHKYEHDSQNIDSLPLFINKLRTKKQSKQQQKKACDSVLFYYKIFNIHSVWSQKKESSETVKETTVPYSKVTSIDSNNWGGGCLQTTQ